MTSLLSLDRQQDPVPQDVVASLREQIDELQTQVERQDAVLNQQEQLLRTVFEKTQPQSDVQKNQLSMVVFSGDLDKLLAAMIIATGAAASGMDVRLFFTFWGTSVLRMGKPVRKDIWGRLFGWLLPKGADGLKLSQLHMGGAGTAAMKLRMEQRGVASLSELLEMAADLNVHIDICTMSMDLMGISRDEIMDYPHLGYCGVASFVEEASQSKTTLFV